MASNLITNSEKFISLSATAQALYFHLKANVMDDSYVDNPDAFYARINASEEHLNELLNAMFIIRFGRGVIVIDNWRLHAAISADFPHIEKDILAEDVSGQIEMVFKPNGIASGSDKKSDEAKLKADFEVIYDSYPKKVGRTKAFARYKTWVTSGRRVNGRNKRLTNSIIWDAIAAYKKHMEDTETDLKYYKNFDTFMGDSILDYVEE